MILGSFDTRDDFSLNLGTVAVPYVTIMFVLCTVLNMIIMLNLLISIISEVFATINAQAVEASYQGKADIIHSNAYLIPKSKRIALAPENKYLLIVTDVGQEIDAGDPLTWNLSVMIDSVEQYNS
jgi:hypothetical protein